MKIRLRHTSARPTFTFRKRRVPELERALYMRPIRPVRMGHVNTEWSTDGWYRHGLPIGRSLVLTLKCGHVEVVPQRPFKLRKLVHCPMCVRLWTERTELAAQSERKSRKRHRQQTETEETIQEMTMKKTKKSASSDDRRGRKTFEFVKVAKKVEDGTIIGIVQKAVQRVKSGTVAEITEAAIKGGLKDVTGQDPLTQTGVMLNRLKSMGAVKKVKVEAVSKKLTLKLRKAS